MISHNKVDLTDPELRKIDEEFGLLKTPTHKVKPVFARRFNDDQSDDDSLYENQSRRANQKDTPNGQGFQTPFQTSRKRSPSTPLRVPHSSDRDSRLSWEHASLFLVI